MNNGISAALIVDVIELAFMLIATHLTVKSLIYSGRIKTSHWYISIPMFFAFLILKSSIGKYIGYGVFTMGVMSIIVPIFFIVRYINKPNETKSDNSDKNS